MKDSTWLASDFNAFQRTEFYKQEVVLPDRTVAMGQRGYAMGNDDYMVAGMVLMFLLLAVVVYKSRVALLYRLKSFFTEKRVYIEENVKEASVATATQVQGKALSYNNIADTDAALECVKEFAEPACVIVKHANPCGVAIGNSILDAYDRAYKTDPTSAFGGIIAFNRELDAETAQAIISR